MKFFVPGFQDQREVAEDIWLTVRSWLADNGLETSRRRIAAVVASIDGVDHFIAVDRDCPFDEAIAMLILESSDGEHFHICTLQRGIGESLPWTLPLDENWRVVDFE